MMNITGETSSPRHRCTFEGCEKSFLRPEHLTRHTQSHYKNQTYVCEICRKEFSRSDSLRRHMKNAHGEALDFLPPGNIDSANVTHDSSSPENDSTASFSKTSTRSVYKPQDVEMHDACSSEVEDVREHQTSVTSTGDLNGHPASKPKTFNGNHTILTASLSNAFMTKDRRVIDWTAFKIPSAPGSATSNSTAGYYTEAKFEDLITMNSIREEYLDLYFTHFHHRWAVLHHPLLDQHGVPSLVASAIVMIGSWLYGTQESKKIAIYIHENVMDQIIPQLTRAQTYRSFPTSSMPLYQTSLLNIIFAFYCGKQSLIARAMILRNILVGVLREVGLFNPETIFEDDRPGYFIILKLSSQEARRRLAIYSFKVDSYLNILKRQPLQLHPEEMHFTLSSTYATYNADGILEFEKRYALEPASRNQNTIRDMLKNRQISESFPDHELLVEDLTLHLCNLYSSIWQVWQNQQDSNADALKNDMERTTLRTTLEELKAKILVFNDAIENAKVRSENPAPFRYYHGREEESHAGWQDKIAARAKSLVRDSLMLYLLLSMNFFTDIPLLRTVSQTHLKPDLDPIAKFKVNQLIEWTKSPDMRRSLWYAAECISLFENLRTDLSNTATGLEKDILDPIAYIALCTAVLIFSTYCTHHDCPSCATAGSDEHSLAIDILDFHTGTDRELKRETWIAKGNVVRVKYKGMKLCVCTKDLLTTRFYSLLPKEWDVPESLALGGSL